MLLFLVLAEIPPCCDFYVVTRSYSSRPFLCALVARSVPPCYISKHHEKEVKVRWAYVGRAFKEMVYYRPCIQNYLPLVQNLIPSIFSLPTTVIFGVRSYHGCYCAVLLGLASHTLCRERKGLVTLQSSCPHSRNLM